MAKHIDITEFLQRMGQLPVLDVRSPSEYNKAHIPGALSLPLFSDEERAAVGTLYSQKGPDHATLLGMDIAGPQMSAYVRKAWKMAPERRAMIYCWRGGWRSAAMAFTLDVAGFETYLLDGGYRSFHRHANTLLTQARKIIVLGGMTGSGKTEVLAQLRQMGEQVVDLEELAEHKGSAFGGRADGIQPSTEQFRNRLFMEVQKTRPDAPLWIEDESDMIGKIRIPAPFFTMMRSAPLVCLNMPQELRARRLAADYDSVELQSLEEAFRKIGRKIGGDRLKEALMALQAGELEKAAMTALDHYDRKYSYGMAQRIPASILRIDTTAASAAENARLVRQAAREHYSELFTE